MKQEKEILNISSRCIDVTLDEFIDCFCNENYKRLIRSGDPTNEEVLEAWSILYAEYCEISGGMRYEYIFNLSQDIYRLSIKLEMVNRIISLGEKEVLSFLKLLKYNGTIKNIEAEIKRQNIVLKEKKAELSRIKGDTGEKMTERDFIKWIVPVSKYMNQRIDKKTTLLLEFLEMSKQMEEYYEQYNKK